MADWNIIFCCGVIILAILWLVYRVASVKVYRFYRPTCPYCVESQPEWNAFKRKCMFRMVRPIDVNIETADRSTISMFHNMSDERTVPYVAAVYPDGYRKEYRGDRTADSYLRWLDMSHATPIDWNRSMYVGQY